MSADCSVGGENGALEECVHEPRGVVVGERRERDRRRVRFPAAPADAAGEELGPRRADDEERDPGRPVDEVVDEVEQAVVRPVQILEHEHEGAPFRHGFEEPAPGGKSLGSTIAARLALLRQPDQRPQVRLDPCAVGSPVERLGHDC